MSKTANINISLDASIIETAETIYSRYGMSLAEAVTVFIHQSCNVGGLPFDLRPKRPNAETLAAMAEAELISRDTSVKGYHDMSALFKDLEENE